MQTQNAHVEGKVNTRLESNGLRVIESACEFSTDRGRGVICVEAVDRDNLSGAIQLLSSTAARNLALGYAASVGVGDPRINGMTMAPYAINTDNVRVEEAKDENGKSLDVRDPRRQPAAYRVDIPVTRRLG